MSSSSSRTLLSDFHRDASSGFGLMISTCAHHPSGCHDFGATFSPEYDRLDRVEKKNGCDDASCKTGCPTFVPKFKKTTYKFLFITGCELDNGAFLLQHLQKKYKINSIESVYIVVPTHLSWDYMETSSYEASLARKNDSFKKVFPSKSYKINLVTTGINCDLPYNLGAPRSYPRSLVVSEVKIPSTCYGLMYLTRTELDSLEAMNYLHGYFSQIENISPFLPGSKERVSVFAIALPVKALALVKKIAAVYGVEVTASKRIPQSEFIRFIKQLAAKKGLVALDGVMTLRQVLNEKGMAFVFNPPEVANNTGYLKTLVKSVSSELELVAMLAMDQCENPDYHYLTAPKRQEHLKRVFDELYLVEQKLVSKFETERKTYAISDKLATTVKIKKALAVEEFSSAKTPSGTTSDVLLAPLTEFTTSSSSSSTGTNVCSSGEGESEEMSEISLGGMHSFLFQSFDKAMGDYIKQQHALTLFASSALSTLESAPSSPHLPGESKLALEDVSLHLAKSS